MRPVNLIPKEEQLGRRAAMHGGPLAYIVLGALLAALAAVTVLVVTNNQISDRKTEITNLNAEIDSAEARADESAAYTQFHQVAEQRNTTISNLANSRFDWERVLRQLSLIVPSDIVLTNLTGTVKPDVPVNGAASIGLRNSIAGPALQMEGCALGQEGVARFVRSLKEIEGVTRVGMQSSALPSANSESGESGSVSANSGCQGESDVALFQIVVAFDAAPIPTTGSGGETEEAAPEAAPAPEESTEASAPEGETGSEGEG
jgi:Tfp pilus assembly protein PilN